jgi:hypothetical protein
VAPGDRRDRRPGRGVGHRATLERIADLSYGGPLTAILADNNSTDRTAEVAEETARRVVWSWAHLEPERESGGR